MAARCCSGSRTPTASARRPRTSSRSSTRSRWLGLDHDEEPVFQSQRAERHAEVVQQLIDSGHAYRSTANREQIDAWKAEHGDRGFRGEDEGEGAVRLRVPDEGTTTVKDVIRGESEFDNRLQDDLVIARADGTPIYHLAVVVDDLDMGVTHVVRGADHYSNTPKQMLILQAMGEEVPLYAHVPLLHGPDGKKLSKRHGAASVQELRERGYLPEAVRNYVALLGWGTEESQEFFTTDELIQAFSLERVSRSPAVFDEQKLRHMNGRYVRELGVDDLTERLEDADRARGAARRGRDLAGEDLDAVRFLAAGRIFLRRAGRRPGRARQDAGRPGGPGAARAGPRGARRRAGAVDRGSAGIRAAGRVGAVWGQAREALPADPRRARRNHRLTRDLRDLAAARTRRIAAPDRRHPQPYVHRCRYPLKAGTDATCP